MTVLLHFRGKWAVRCSRDEWGGQTRRGRAQIGQIRSARCHAPILLSDCSARPDNRKMRRMRTSRKVGVSCRKALRAAKTLHAATRALEACAAGKGRIIEPSDEDKPVSDCRVGPARSSERAPAHRSEARMVGLRWRKQAVSPHGCSPVNRSGLKVQRFLQDNALRNAAALPVRGKCELVLRQSRQTLRPGRSLTFVRGSPDGDRPSKIGASMATHPSFHGFRQSPQRSR